MKTAQEGFEWLESLAVRYDELARSIRATADLVRQAEATKRPAIFQDAPTEGVPVSEAIRMALNAKQPLKPRKIRAYIQAERIALRSKSGNIPRLIDSTLSSMRTSGQVKLTPNGWGLISSAKD